jgi:hypothetical protein
MIEETKEFMNVEEKSFKVTTIEEKSNYQFGISYSFDVGYAQKFGVNEAIFLQNIIFWLRQNKANNKNFFDGKFWTYNSQNAYTKLFPFWTESQIKRIIKSLIDKKVIIIGHYNENKYNHTNWYALVDESMIDNEIIDKTNSSNQIDENDESNRRNRPYIYTDIKPDIKPDIYGEYKNIKLSQEEKEKLDTKYTQEQTKRAIEYLSCYKKEKNYKTKSDYLTLRRWVFDAISKITIENKKDTKNWEDRKKEIIKENKGIDSYIINNILEKEKIKYLQ